jgi:hypothetical protein
VLTGLLPACAVLQLAALLHRWHPARGRLDAILTSALLVATGIVLSTEGLSLIGAIRFWPLVAGWTIANVALATVWLRSAVWSGWRAAGLQQFDAWRRDAWAIGVSVLATLTLLIALASAPNTWDSMTYHLARVAQWEQRGSVSHYPTHILRQLHQAPGAEFILLQLQVLAGTDRFANGVQWVAYGLAAISAMLTARAFGLGRLGERFSAVFVLTAPMAILQSHSTQNDLLVGAWLGAFVLYGCRWLSSCAHTELLRAALALGLALLTKSTAFLFAAPFVLWFAVATIRRDRARSWWPALCVVGLVAVLNTGYVVRNAALYGHPLGPGREAHMSYRADTLSPAAGASGVARNLALQCATPIDVINRALTDAVRWGHDVAGVDPDDPRTTWPGTTFSVARSNRHEDTEGSPLHLLVLAGGLCGAAIAWWRRCRFAPVTASAACALLGAVLFACVLKWQPWHTRLHLPLWVLLAPPLAAIVSRTRVSALPAALSIVLTLWAVPIVLRAHSRPLIGSRSVFTTPRIAQYFRNRRGVQEEYESVARRIAECGAGTVGLRLDLDDWEYPLHVMCASAVRLQHISVSNVSARLATPDAPEPDAVICTSPGGRAELDADPAWHRTAGGDVVTLFERS